ncbi:auxin response factor 11 [Hordeum vulgare]|nr:auxin response factor 11 [Hordeum vulgare]
MALFLFSPAGAPPSRPPAGRSPPPAAPPPSEPPNPSSLPHAAPSLPCLLLASPLSTRRPQLAAVREVDGRQQWPGSRNEGPLSDSNVYEDHDDPSEAKHCRHRLNQAKEQWEAQGAKKVINSKLWHACTGPLVCLTQRGSLLYYFPQGHNEQADKDTDEVYAQMTLQPVNSETDVFPIQSLGSYAKSKHPTEYFYKNLTASDMSTHDGFPVPRRATGKLFPQLDYSMQPPNQELIVQDLHDNMWIFRHIYREQSEFQSIALLSYIIAMLNSRDVS